MIEFQCKECKCNVSTFDDHLGERVCDDCGLVYITNPFEETIRIVTENYHPNKGYKFARGVDNDGRLGSFISYGDVKERKDAVLRSENLRTHGRLHTDCDKHMYALAYNTLWKYNIADRFRERVRIYYKALQKNRILDGLSIETRAAGLTYFILKEANITVRLRNHAEITRVSTSQIAKCAKKIAKFHKKSHVFVSISPTDDARNAIYQLQQQIPIVIFNEVKDDLNKMVEYVYQKCQYSGMHYSLNTLNAIIWLVGRTLPVNSSLTQPTIVKAFGGSEAGLRQAAKRVCDMIGIDKDEIHNYNVDEIVNGIRHG